MTYMNCELEATTTFLTHNFSSLKTSTLTHFLVLGTIDRSTTSTSTWLLAQYKPFLNLLKKETNLLIDQHVKLLKHPQQPSPVDALSRRKKPQQELLWSANDNNSKDRLDLEPPSPNHVRAVMTTDIDSAFDRFTTKIPMLKNHRITVELQEKVTATTEYFFEQLIIRDNIISEYQKEREQGNIRRRTVTTSEEQVEETSEKQVEETSELRTRNTRLARQLGRSNNNLKLQSNCSTAQDSSDQKYGSRGSQMELGTVMAENRAIGREITRLKQENEQRNAKLREKDTEIEKLRLNLGQYIWARIWSRKEGQG
jgi:hypothetical protein